MGSHIKTFSSSVFASARVLLLFSICFTYAAGNESKSRRRTSCPAAESKSSSTLRALWLSPAAALYRALSLSCRTALAFRDRCVCCASLHFITVAVAVVVVEPQSQLALAPKFKQAALAPTPLLAAGAEVGELDWLTWFADEFCCFGSKFLADSTPSPPLLRLHATVFVVFTLQRFLWLVDLLFVCRCRCCAALAAAFNNSGKRSMTHCVAAQRSRSWVLIETLPFHARSAAAAQDEREREQSKQSRQAGGSAGIRASGESKAACRVHACVRMYVCVLVWSAWAGEERVWCESGVRTWRSSCMDFLGSMQMQLSCGREKESVGRRERVTAKKKQNKNKSKSNAWLQAVSFACSLSYCAKESQQKCELLAQRDVRCAWHWAAVRPQGQQQQRQQWQWAAGALSGILKCIRRWQ